jgi:SAM-dependent methyltransferase
VDTADCRTCLHTFTKQNSVWRMLRPERVAPIESFLADYTKIRLAEGRGSADAAFYRNLPECPDDHPMAWQWGIRRRTFSYFRERVLPSMGAHLRILDLGAGTGWLCNKLAQLGHEPCAIDLSCNDRDGLEAARHFNSSWPCVQAEFDYLPFPNASVDAVVFNASLHYSTDYVRTLREALRVLAPRGFLVVLETPVYKSESSGRRMIKERHELFLKRYATRSDSVPSLEYLTWTRVAELGRKLNLKWKIMRPWYGLRWALRPWIARVTMKREPSQFPVLIAAGAQVPL